MHKKKLAVFISGYGSNLNVFLQNKDKFADLYVVSSNAEAYGLVRAENCNVDRLVLEQPLSWLTLQQKLIERGTEVIFLAGFMRILPASFVNLWEGRLFNLHPSLLPKYKGLNSIQRAHAAGDEIGVTIHQVTAEVDSGHIVAQKIAVSQSEVGPMSLEEATQRTHACEHELVLAWINSL